MHAWCRRLRVFEESVSVGNLRLRSAVLVVVPDARRLDAVQAALLRQPVVPRLVRRAMEPERAGAHRRTQGRLPGVVLRPSAGRGVRRRVRHGELAGGHRAADALHGRVRRGAERPDQVHVINIIIIAISNIIITIVIAKAPSPPLSLSSSLSLPLAAPQSPSTSPPTSAIIRAYHLSSHPIIIISSKHPRRQRQQQCKVNCHESVHYCFGSDRVSSLVFVVDVDLPACVPPQINAR